MINRCSSQTAARIASVLTGLLLLTAALLFLGWSAGDWWIANPRPSRWYLAAFVVTSFSGFVGWTWRGTSSRRRAPRRRVVRVSEPRRDGPNRSRGDVTAALHRSPVDSILVVYASETGFAEALAQQTCEQLQGLGRQIRLAPIDGLTCEHLVAARQVLFIASTAGQGDPPDHAIEFSESVMQRSMRLDSLHFGVLALGDRSYDEYCAFGHQLANWLLACGGKALFDVIEVDDGDEEALRQWRCCLASASSEDGINRPDWVGGANAAR